MKTSNAQVKVLIFDAINFVDDVDREGNNLRRQSFPRDYYRSIASVEEKLKSDVLVCIGTYLSDEQIESLDSPDSYRDFPEEQKRQLSMAANGVKWKSVDEIEDFSGIFELSNKFSSNELEFTTDEVAGIKYCWESRKDKKKADLQAYDELEEGLK